MKINNNNPIQYQRGWVEFYKLKFKVTPDVLIPRSETELLAEAVIKLVHSSLFIVHSRDKQASTNHQLPTTNPITILDIGTGAGNVAISIAKNLPAGRQDLTDVKIVATDISKKALKVASQNAKFHQVEDRITFLASDLLRKVDQTADIFVANLPYIPSARIPYLDSSVKDFEPHVALDGGIDGFSLYRKLFIQMIQKNFYPKYLIAEIDYTHAEIAVNEALKYFPKCEVEIKHDLARRQRFLIIKF